ncbi:MAG: PAS domain S-box protein [Blastocatellia bacterium]|nr:PAS domain S-box protein [Blastocatellia bacterium]
MPKSHLDKYFLAAIVESSQDSIVSVDFDLKITSWNRSAEELYGYPANEVMGKQLTKLTLPEDLSLIMRKVEQIRASKVLEIFETERVKKCGSTVCLEVMMSPVKDSEGAVIGISTIARDITERKRIADAVKKKEILANLLAAQERERTRIAMDLHDELGQHITALRLKLQVLGAACTQPDIEEGIKDIEEIALNIDDSVSVLAHELRPHAIGDKQLVEAITVYLATWAKHFGLTAAIDTDGLTDAEFDAATESHVYRIVQEALNNTLKHAKATNVEIMLTERGNDVVLIITDDGVGFDSTVIPTFPNGLGVTGMKERAWLIGGALEIESAPGKGTSLFVKFPRSNGS